MKYTITVVAFLCFLFSGCTVHQDIQEYCYYYKTSRLLDSVIENLQKEDYAAALHLLLEIKELQEKYGGFIECKATTMNIGNIYLKLNDYTSAEKTYQSIIDTYRELNLEPDFIYERVNQRLSDLRRNQEPAANSVLDSG